MDSEAQILLDDVIEFCRRDGADARLINMLGQSRAIELTDEALAIEAPSRFAYSFLNKNRDAIEPYLEQIAFMPLALAISAPSGSAPAARPQAEHTAPQTAASAPLRAADGPQQQPGAVRPAPLRTAAPIAHEKEPGSVKVTNTLSRDEFLRMMGKTDESAARPAAAPTPAVSEEPRPAVPINTKFTFDNFVYGDENKHAYRSAQHFAAFADKPGQYSSLFIYGDSGLGKTHLLLAIKNYLAQEMPHIRVKYANSQTYIDDFINEIGRQKTDGGQRMREYHDANVLIIDDIQNIIGKDASIEYFFSLMDEFIRMNKKVVIASDRAPKNLGMDERLTSRFNAGMLCLVSKPGFEMKFAILKHYYESAIMAHAEGAGMDGSLLGGLGLTGGTLTESHLKHMAEVSGNNIRELESFCERCASLSFDREQSGSELTAEDIDQVADEYFDTARKVIHVDIVQSVVEEFYHVSHQDMVSKKRSKDIAFPRHVAVYLTNCLCEMSTSAIGAQFGGRDHSTVLNSIRKVREKMEADRGFCEDLERLRNAIALKA